MAEATGIEIGEIKPISHETPEKSFSNLGVLSWFSSNPGQRPSWLDTGPTKWFATRQLLSTLDWRKSLTTAIWQNFELGKYRLMEKPITKSEKDDKIIAFNKAFYEIFNSADTKVFRKTESLLSNSAVNFGPQLGIQEKTFRLYVNPRMDPDSYVRVLSTLKEIFISKSIIGQIKVNTEAMYKELSEGKFVPSEHEDKLAIYLNAGKGTDITSLLQGLADSNIFGDLEDSGQWALAAKIPIAKGVSFVEATGESWDTVESKSLAVIQQIGRLSFTEDKFNRVVEKIITGPKNANLGNSKRVPQMPGLLLQSPLQKV